MNQKPNVYIVLHTIPSVEISLKQQEISDDWLKQYTNYFFSWRNRKDSS